MAVARIDRIDDAVGTGIERLVVAHHRRRLKRHGWQHAYDPPNDGLWCAGEPPPRDGNKLEVLVDGEHALGRLQEDLAGARDSVLLAGWHFEPSFRLTRGGPTLRELLAEAAGHADVRALAWAGAPLPLFKPSRSDVRETRETMITGTKIRMELDAKERPMYCHHEKLAVIDGRVAYVNGIDLTSLAGDRLDSSEHPARGAIGWHDAGTRIEGPLVRDVADHILLRWRAVTDETLELACDDSSQGGVRAQLVRTAGRTTGKTTLAASSACSRKRTATSGCSRARCSNPGTSSRSTSTRRSASSTTAGSASAPRTSTSTRSTTTPRRA
jgi:phosphatidylserine/phosphatidylglycerophosphate/cardiolipin synthase-like enzyme